MALIQSLIAFLKQYIWAGLSILLSALLIAFWRVFWIYIPFQISDSANRLILGRSIVILAWAVYILLTICSLHSYQAESPKGINRKLLGRFKEQLNLFYQAEQNHDDLRQWTIDVEPLFDYVPKFKDLFISSVKMRCEKDDSLGYDYHKKGRQGIIDAMDKTIATLKTNLDIS